MVVMVVMMVMVVVVIVLEGTKGRCRIQRVNFCDLMWRQQRENHAKRTRISTKPAYA